jgi:hypothetical protein
MKTTIEIADDLLARARKTARQEDRTLRELVEEGLDLALSRRAREPRKKIVLPTSGGDGVTDEFKDWKWEKFRDLIYADRSA